MPMSERMVVSLACGQIEECLHPLASSVRVTDGANMSNIQYRRPTSKEETDSDEWAGDESVILLLRPVFSFLFAGDPTNRLRNSKFLLDVGHGEDLTSQLSWLVGGMVDTVEDGVAVDPCGQSRQFVGVKLDVIVTGPQQLDQAAAASTVQAARWCDLDLVAASKARHPGVGGRRGIGACSPEVTVTAERPIGLRESVARASR